MSADLIFEIGCEELPASFIGPALELIASGWTGEAARLRISHGEVRTLGTPRRLALLVRDVAARAEDVEERGEGPALSSAFDAEGRPTKAAEGFARKWGLTVDQLGRENGRLVASRTVAGRDTIALLPELLSQLIVEAARNRKTMRWGAPGPMAVRLAGRGRGAGPIRRARGGRRQLRPSIPVSRCDRPARRRHLRRPAA